ncbi:hypothetical protein [Psychromonas sp. MME2]|uniref:hypothetical protein n=1 Tax=Psychromonas sp. MME2 TaxID=3231033 RepID=UPI00339BBFFC
MLKQTEMCFCKSCAASTHHILVLVRKPNPFKNVKNRKRKEFIAGLIKGLMVGPFIAAMDDFLDTLYVKSVEQQQSMTNEVN